MTFAKRILKFIFDRQPMGDMLDIDFQDHIKTRSSENISSMLLSAVRLETKYVSQSLSFSHLEVHT